MSTDEAEVFPTFVDGCSPKRNIGKGGFGTVYLCTKLDANGKEEEHAIKVVPNYNRDKTFLKSVYREISILLRAHSINQVVPLYGLEIRREAAGVHHDQKDLHVDMAYVKYNLAELIQSRVIESEKMIKNIICQLLLGVRALHGMGILHRDLSSRNILVSKDTYAYICDFGLARLYDPDEQMSYGVITQWYRAPEVLLDCKYGYPVDVWAIGVMMAELFLQDHLFQGRNKDKVHQVEQIFSLLGSISLAAMLNDAEYGSASENAKQYVRTHPTGKGRGIENLKFSPRITVADETSVKELLAHLLELSPLRRWSADQALDHPWFQFDKELSVYIADERRKHSAAPYEEKQEPEPKDYDAAISELLAPRTPVVEVTPSNHPFDAEHTHCPAPQ